MAILDVVRKELRIDATDNDFDDEITSLIATCKIDLGTGGVGNTDDTDPLVERAIILYSKAHFGMANPDMEKYERMYDKLKIQMALATGYKKEVS